MYKNGIIGLLFNVNIIFLYSINFGIIYIIFCKCIFNMFKVEIVGG